MLCSFAKFAYARMNVLYTITFITMFFLTYSVWYVILSGIRVWFTESHIHLVISFCLFANLFLGTRKNGVV
jgi:hypothetical protein